MSNVIRSALASLGLLASSAQALSPIEGPWLTDDRKAIIVIGRCGASLCGRISKVLDPDPTVPKTDVNNPAAALRGRAIVGLPVLYGLTFRSGRWSNGTAYDPKTGRSYRAALEAEPGDTLRVTGCVVVFCRTKVWVRPDRSPPTSAAAAAPARQTG